VQGPGFDPEHCKKKKKKEKQVTLIPVIFYLTPYIKK
jgi:hypothetical protein